MTFSLTPQEIYGELFESVQRARIFSDSKTFVDAVPRRAPDDIVQRFMRLRDGPAFELKSFVLENFELPEMARQESPSQPFHDAQAEIEQLWTKLTRAPDQKEQHSSLIELPKPYVVPGGRFRELYYWDSYFTMLGLVVSGRLQMLRDMVDNFSFLIDQIGFIPNGTRSYFCTRSQPPYFVMMLELLANATADDTVYRRYLPQLEREYAFWMAGAETLAANRTAVRRVVKVDGVLLNRYWDDSDRPRQESYAEDIAVAVQVDRDPSNLYRDIRAACESGWDFSSRWFEDSLSISSIRTTSLLPVDLNCIMHRIEVTLGNVYDLNGDAKRASFYKDRAAQRKAAIQLLFFNKQEDFFFDIVLSDQKPTRTLSLAAVYPLFFDVATDDQAARVANRLERDFLRPGGWVTTLATSGQQWDAPNGWAPLQWIAYEGLQNFGHDELAQTAASRWIDNNMLVYRDSGRFMEKYNVDTPGLAATGGEYTVQDGFGWTNGVLLRLLSRTDKACTHPESAV